jgi:hypothetical protein
MFAKFRRFLIPVLAVLILIVATVWFVGGTNSFAGNIIKPITDKSLVVCQVQVSNQAFKAPHIESFVCEKRSFCLTTPNSLSIIPTDTSFVKAVASDGASSATVKLIITEQIFSDTSKTVELRVCTASNTGNINLYNANNEVLSRASWNVGVTS